MNGGGNQLHVVEYRDLEVYHDVKVENEMVQASGAFVQLETLPGFDSMAFIHHRVGGKLVLRWRDSTA